MKISHHLLVSAVGILKEMIQSKDITLHLAYLLIDLKKKNRSELKFKLQMK